MSAAGSVRLAVGALDRLEQHVGHQRARMVLARIAQPGVQPLGAVGIAALGQLGADARQVGALRHLAAREIAVLVARQAADLEGELAALGRRPWHRSALGGWAYSNGWLLASRYSTMPRISIGSRFSATRAGLRRPRWFHRPKNCGILVDGPEIAGLADPGVEEVEIELAGHVAQAGTDFAQLARRLDVVQQRSPAAWSTVGVARQRSRRSSATRAKRVARPRRSRLARPASSAQRFLLVAQAAAGQQRLRPRPSSSARCAGRDRSACSVRRSR